MGTLKRGPASLLYKGRPAALASLRDFAVRGSQAGVAMFAYWGEMGLESEQKQKREPLDYNQPHKICRRKQDGADY